MTFQQPKSGLTRRAALALTAAPFAAPFLGLATPARADAIVLKFSHVVSPDAPKGKAALLFKQLAESSIRAKRSQAPRAKIQMRPQTAVAGGTR